MRLCDREGGGECGDTNFFVFPGISVVVGELPSCMIVTSNCWRESEKEGKKKGKEIKRKRGGIKKRKSKKKKNLFSQVSI